MSVPDFVVCCSFSSVCAPAVVYGSLEKSHQCKIATEDFYCEGLLLAHLFNSHPKQKFQNHRLASRFLGQSIFAVNNCHDFHRLFRILFIPSLSLAEYCSLKLTTKKQLLQENQIMLTPLLSRFHLEFMSECDNQSKQGRALLCFSRLFQGTHSLLPACTVVCVKKNMSTHITAAL